MRYDCSLSFISLLTTETHTIGIKIHLGCTILAQPSDAYRKSWRWFWILASGADHLQSGGSLVANLQCQMSYVFFGWFGCFRTCAVEEAIYKQTLSSISPPLCHRRPLSHHALLHLRRQLRRENQCLRSGLKGFLFEVVTPMVRVCSSIVFLFLSIDSGILIDDQS